VSNNRTPKIERKEEREEEKEKGRLDLLNSCGPGNGRKRLLEPRDIFPQDRVQRVVVLVNPVLFVLSLDGRGDELGHTSCSIVRQIARGGPLPTTSWKVDDELGDVEPSDRAKYLAFHIEHGLQWCSLMLRVGNHIALIDVVLCGLSVS
jgi:hypothetical protein